MAEITYAGHSAVFMEFNGYKIVIDPWLSDNPLCPEHLKNPDKLDAIILTHGHSDHASQAAELAMATGANLLATYELAVLMIEAGVSETKAIPMNKGGSVNLSSVDLGTISITLTHALHSNSFDSATGTRYAGEACGVIVQANDICLYHAGDTALFSDMSLIANSYKPDLAFLPIGDRFTMGPKEAALAAQYLSVSLAVPIHYKTFPQLTGSPSEFAEHLSNLAPDCKMLELRPGQTHHC